MNDEETMDYLNDLLSTGMKLGLERMKELLDRMGNPQKKLKFVHIAGTNGKGSVTMMTAGILKQAGYQTGVYLSPHVLCYRECMQINGEFISGKELAECVSYVRHFAEEMASGHEESPTKFEIETAAAFEWFNRRGCDVVCLEVGLGGRLDATNVIEKPVLSVITSISLDHTAVLGNSILDIAFEKSGIIKGGTAVMYPIQDKDAEEMIRNRCKETNTNLVIPDLNKLMIQEHDWISSDFLYDGLAVRKSLCGSFQVYNAITVCEAARCLQAEGFEISRKDMAYGIGHCRLPARMEVFSLEPLIILDGAHNPSGAASLESVLKNFRDRKITIIMGILKDKDYVEVLRHIGPYSTEFLAVPVSNARGLEAEVLAEEAKRFTDKTEVHTNLSEALEAALNRIKKEDVLVICGSLYLASEIRPILIEVVGRRGVSLAGGVL